MDNVGENENQNFKHLLKKQDIKTYHAGLEKECNSETFKIKS